VVVAAGSSGQEAGEFWATEGYQELLALEGQGAMFDDMAFSPNGSVLSSRSSLGKARLHLWRAPSWAEIEAAEKTTEAKTQ
jgi:WD40 repeat protein